MPREADLARRSAVIRKYFRQTVSNKAVVSQYLQDAEVEMDMIQAAIYALQSKGDHLKETTNLYRSLLSPVYSVPSEILTMVFTFVLSEGRLPEAIRLSMVCGRWRDIVRSTPSLWSSISIDFSAWTGNFHVLNQLTEHYMQQSKDSPLQLSLDFPERPFDELESDMDLAQVRLVLRTLIQNCSRWKLVDLGMFSTFLPFDVLAPIRGHLPSLTSLFLRRFGYVGWDAIADDSVMIFDNCPSLRSLTTQVPISDQLHLPWTQIKDLELDDLFSDVALQLLSVCPNVEEVNLTRGGNVYVGTENFTGHIVSDTVKSFVVRRADEQRVMDDMLRHVTFKKLSTLVLRACNASLNEQWPTWNGAHLEAFLTRSSCTLTTLELIFVPMTDKKALSLLRSLPTIETLEIGELLCHDENRIITKHFLGGLASPNLHFSGPVLPRLTNMKLLVHVDKVDTEALLRVFSYRWLPDGARAEIECLQSVTIVALTKTRPPTENMLECLRCFRKAGMSLKVSSASTGPPYVLVARVPGTLNGY